MLREDQLKADGSTSSHCSHEFLELAATGDVETGSVGRFR